MVPSARVPLRYVRAEVVVARRLRAQVTPLVGNGMNLLDAGAGRPLMTVVPVVMAPFTDIRPRSSILLPGAVRYWGDTRGMKAPDGVRFVHDPYWAAGSNRGVYVTPSVDDSSGVTAPGAAVTSRRQRSCTPLATAGLSAAGRTGR